VRARTAISISATITIKTKNLEIVRESGINYGLVHSITTKQSIVPSAITVYVICSKEKGFSFSTAGTDPPIMIENLVADSSVMPPVAIFFCVRVAFIIIVYISATALPAV
jgi:hypothetical protein